MTNDELRAWRNAKNMTQTDLATLCGVTVRQIKRYEKGEYPIPALLALYTIEHPATPRESCWHIRNGEPVVLMLCGKCT